MGYLVERQVNSQIAQIGASVLTISLNEMIDIGNAMDKMVKAIWNSYILAGKQTEAAALTKEWNALPNCTGWHLEETNHTCMTTRIQKAIPIMDSLMKRIVVDMPNSTTLWDKIKHLWGLGSPITYTGWANVINEWVQIKKKIPVIQQEAETAAVAFAKAKQDKKDDKNKIWKTITTVAISLAVIVVGVKVIPIISKVIPKRRG